MVYSSERTNLNRDSLYAISLFSGAGGFDLGIEASGFTTRLCTDVDYHSCQTLLNNKFKLLNQNKVFKYLHDANIVQKDIKNYSTDDILNDAKLSKYEVSLIYGGPPCQSFSVFGQRKGMDDPRGTLLWDYLRIIREINPQCFIFENVAGLLTIDEGRIFNSFKDELALDDNGQKIYNISSYLLDTVNFGVPEFRSRVIVFGCKSKKISPPKWTHASSIEKITDILLPPVTVDQALHGLPQSPNPIIPNHIGRLHGEAVIERYRALSFGERDPKTRINRLNPKKPSFTIVVGSDKGGGKGHVHPYCPREVTPRESARIQTFPDFWEFSGSSRHPIRQIGNAVPPVFASVLGSHVMHEVFGRTNAPSYEEIIDRLGLDFLLPNRVCANGV